MSQNGFPSWPPIWVHIADPLKRPFKSDEIGVLTQVGLHDQEECRIYLRMHDGDADYFSRLLFDDPAFCTKVYEVLQDHVGQPMKNIGDIDSD